MSDHPVGQRAQLLGLAAVAEVLEMPEAHETRTQPGDHRRGFDTLAPHRAARPHQAQRPRGRDAQRRHGFRAQKFADGRTQHRPAVAHARKRRAAAALELHFPAGIAAAVPPAAGIWPVAQQQRAAVAKLPCPVAELMPGVHRGATAAADRRDMAAQGQRPVLLVLRGGGRSQADQRRGVGAGGHQHGVGQGTNRDGHAECVAQGGKLLR